MKKVVYVFTGQGSQHSGMGSDLYAKYEAARVVFDEASSLSGIDVRALCFHGTDEELAETRNTQLAVFTFEVAAFNAFSAGLTCNSAGPAVEVLAAAGHSLGEYAALVASSCLTFRDGVALIKKRAGLMSEIRGCLAVVAGLEAGALDLLMTEYSGELFPAVYNTQTLIVVGSRNEKVLLDFLGHVTARGAKATKLMQVSGPFHTPAYDDVSRRFLSHLKDVSFSEPAFPVFSNVEATVYKAGDAAQNLYRQMTHPVRWLDIMKKIESLAPDYIVEFGPVKPGERSHLYSLFRMFNRKLSSKVMTVSGDRPLQLAVDALQ